MSFYRAFYHLVWATKYRSELLTPEVESFAYEVIRAKAIQMGVMVFALNGTENHVHLVATIPPTLSICEVVKQIKGISSFRLNQSGSYRVPLLWQTEFGMFTFDEKRFPNYMHYVEGQKEHHAQNQLIPILERIDSAAPPKVQKNPPHYLTNKHEWWSEMLNLE